MVVGIASRLNRELIRVAGLSLPDYEVLSALAATPSGMLRAYELGADLQWEKSRLSHHLKRMSNRGLIERVACESDGRGLWVSIAPAGRGALQQAAPVHDAMIADLLTLEDEGLQTLAEVSEKVVASMPGGDELCDS
jgi:DNA-binding MarR family transcriptional regulator